MSMIEPVPVDTPRHDDSERDGFSWSILIEGIRALTPKEAVKIVGNMAVVAFFSDESF